MSAQDKASGKSQKITITSDKGRLGQDEIERMIREAEENAEADKQQRQRVEAKNQLESYLYSLRSSAEDSLKDVLSADDKQTILNTVKDALAWLEGHLNDDTQSYEAKRKEVEAVAGPIISKAYAQKGGAPASSPAPEERPSEPTDSGDDASPTVEEVDED